METVSLALNLLGALGVFLYGLKVMSEGLQKLAGTRLRQVLAKATTNRFSATLSGFLVTCAVQSSSATTVMVVGFCSAGLLTLGQSLGVIMGANIGTTTTAWLVSLLGFKVKIAKFAVPLIGIGFFSQFIKRWRLPHRLGEVLVGFGLLFLGLSLLKNTIPNVKDAPEMLTLISRFSPDTLYGFAYAILAGTLMTVAVQSSSAAMAITLTAAAQGLIDFPTAAALAIGQNIGTTCTALLAAIGSPLIARRAALGHFLFNVLGVLPVILIFSPFLSIVDVFMPGDPYGSGTAANIAVTTHLALFHTLFNVLNTVLFLPFIRQFETLIVTLMPGTEAKAAEHELVYLSTPFSATPELSIIAAQKEVDRMADICVNMVKKIRRSLAARGKERTDLLAELLVDEKTTDILEHKITTYLAELTHGHLSTPANKQVLSMLSMVNDLERIGDHGEKVSILLQREADGSYAFTKDAWEELGTIADEAGGVLNGMKTLIMHPEEDPLPQARDRENALNDMRNLFRRRHLERLAHGECSALAGVVFSDLLTSFEKMGDHAFNVVEATAGIK
ncbi:MAG: Na/Pi cotransporter [Elusimicrobia bacterium]|nr:MAG: Na/Pi cotransporter [Elusimicrobiota bacterium]